MTDYLSQLVMRVQEAAPILEPRVPSYYEDTPQPPPEAPTEAAEWMPAAAIDEQSYHSLLAPVVAAPIEAGQPAPLWRAASTLPNLAPPVRADVTHERSIRPEPARVQPDEKLSIQPAPRSAPEGVLQSAKPPGQEQQHRPDPVAAGLDEIQFDGHLTEANWPAPKPQVFRARDRDVATRPIALIEPVTRVRAERPPIEHSLQDEGPIQTRRAPFGLDVAASTRPIALIEPVTRVHTEQPPVKPSPQNERPMPLLTPAPAIFKPLPLSDRGERATAPTPATDRTIHVTIGRVEIRAVTAPPTPARVAKSAPSAMGLQDYLKQRQRGRHE